MRLFVVDSFTAERFMGNQAGVALLDEGEDYPDREEMRILAAELKHSETAFVKKSGNTSYTIRYFTPVEEVDLCGHATIALFTVLREVDGILPGIYIADTPAGQLSIAVQDEMIWMDMADPVKLYEFGAEECKALYSAYGLPVSAGQPGLAPQIIATGLRDILLPVADKKTLDSAVMHAGQVSSLSRQYDVVGVHMFCPGDAGYAAYCRNFAPLYDIPEEAATGTSNGGLAYYLREHGIIEDDRIYTFAQGEVLGKKSYIYTSISRNKVKIGGQAVITLECRLYPQTLPRTKN